MSKASEWARRRADAEAEHRAANAAKPIYDGWGMQIGADDDGNMQAIISHTFKPAEAVKLARWIIDTFGDEP